MLIFRILHVLTFAACLSLGVLVFIQNPRRSNNQFFLLLTGALSLWLSFMMLAFQAGTAGTSALFIRLTNGAAIFVPYLFDCLRIAVMKPDRPFARVLVHNPLWLAMCFAIAAMCHLPFFLRGVAMPLAPMVDVPEPDYGPGILLYGVYFLFTLVSLCLLYSRDVRLASGVRKIELQFIMLSWATGTVVGVTFSMLIPVLSGNPQAVQFLPVTAFFILGIIAYGIATRRIMAVADVLRRVTAHALLLAYLAAVYAGTWLLSRWGLQPLEWNEFAAHLIAAVAVAFSMAPAHGWMQQFARRLFINIELPDVTDLLNRTNRIITSITTRDELFDQFAALLAKSVGTDKILILLQDGGAYLQSFPAAPPAEPVRIEPGEALVALLSGTTDPLAMDTLHRIRKTPLESRAGQLLAALGASIAIGIRAKTGLRGIVLMGPRLSGRIYGITEQRALQVLCDQLAVGLDNTDLYTQIRDSAVYNNILLESLLTGVIAINREGRITTCNREAQRILGQRGVEFVGHPVDRLPPTLAQALYVTLQNGFGVRSVETALPAARGEDLPVRYSTTAFTSHTGKQLGALLVMEDLTIIRKLEDQVRRTDRLASIGTLSAGMAHEIKNPLVTLKTFTQLLPERYQDADFRDTFSSLVGQEVKRIDAIVNQLLRFARPQKPSLHPMHVHEQLDGTLRLLHQQLKQKQIGLVREFEAASDLIHGDKDMLAQAFLNFFLNALDAMESGGTLTVRTELYEYETNQFALTGRLATETRLRVVIRDTGQGIRPEDIPHVFDPFFTTKPSGTGLGLSVSHGIIVEHKGLVDIESEVGRGSAIFVVFPLAAVEATA